MSSSLPQNPDSSIDPQEMLALLRHVAAEARYRGEICADILESTLLDLLATPTTADPQRA
jgi:hypothetical protein